MVVSVLSVLTKFVCFLKFERTLISDYNKNRQNLRRGTRKRRRGGGAAAAGKEQQEKKRRRMMRRRVKSRNEITNHY